MSNRVRKCRAWDVQRKKMYPHSELMGFSLEFIGTIEQLINEITFGLDLMEYVGTINFVDLYDGDILKWTDTEGYGYEEGSYTVIYEVKWNEKDLRYDLYDPFSGEWWALNDTAFDTLMGNRYENPELLNGAKA